MLDKKLTWTPHIKALKDNCHSRLNILKVLAGTSWGSDRLTLLRIYQTLIRSKLDYGSIIYSSAKPAILRLLDTVHHTAIRLSSGAFKSSPVISLCAESGEPPLTFRRQQLACNYISKLYFNTNNPSFSYIFKPKFNKKYQNQKRLPLPLRLRYKLFIENVSNYKITKSVHLDPPWKLDQPHVNRMFLHFNKERDPIVIRHLFKELISKRANDLVIYTDGSRIENKTGFAVFYGHGTSKYKLPDICNNFTAELAGISTGLTYALSQNYTKILICSDSISALTSILHLYSDNNIVLNIHHYLNEAKRLFKTVEFMWIPSHIGIYGNEIADKAAKDAALSSLHQPINIFTARDLQRWFKSRISTAWQDLWDSTDPNNKLKQIKSSIKSWHSSSRPKRREETAITRLRIGHTKLTHEHLINKLSVPLCIPCQQQITIKHIIEDCQIYKNQLASCNIQRSLQQSLSNSTSNMDNIIKFLKTSGLMPKI